MLPSVVGRQQTLDSRVVRPTPPLRSASFERPAIKIHMQQQQQQQQEQQEQEKEERTKAISEMFASSAGAAAASDPGSGGEPHRNRSGTSARDDTPGTSNGGQANSPSSSQSTGRATLAGGGDMEVESTGSSGDDGYGSDGGRVKHPSGDLADDDVFAAAAAPAARRGAAAAAGVHDELVRQAERLVANGCQVRGSGRRCFLLWC